MKKSILALAVGLMLLAGGALVAGCGGDDDPTAADGGEVASSGGSEGNDGEAPGPGGPAGDGGDSAGRDGSANGGEASRGGGGQGSPGAGSASGDGSSEGGRSAEGAPPSGAKADFVAQANALCREQRKQIKGDVNAIFRGAQNKSTKAQQDALRELVSQAIVPGLEAEAEGLRELDAPPGDEGKIEALADAIEAVIAEAQKGPTAFLSNATAFDETRKLARGYGIAPCGTLS